MDFDFLYVTSPISQLSQGGRSLLSLQM